MGKRGKNELLGNEKLQVCRWLATGYSAERVAQLCEEVLGKTVSRQNIHQNYMSKPRWKGIITRLTREAERKLADHVLMKKQNRLNILLEAINEALNWRIDKIQYDRFGRELCRIEKRHVGNIASLIREARAEAEGEKGITIYNSNTNNNANSNGELKKHREEAGRLLHEYFG